MSWLESKLNEINTKINDKVRDKKRQNILRELNLGDGEERRYNEKVDTPTYTFVMSDKEKKALSAFASKMEGYRTKGVSHSIISFANQGVFATILQHSTSDVDGYINASQYWQKKTVKLKGSTQKIVFAENKSMKCVIYMDTSNDTFVLTTMSSFDALLVKYEEFIQNNVIVEQMEEYNEENTFMPF